MTVIFFIYTLVSSKILGQVKWFMIVTLATQEVEIMRFVVSGQPGKNVSKTPSLIQ
jgi:hypothetical protein